MGKGDQQSRAFEWLAAACKMCMFRFHAPKSTRSLISYFGDSKVLERICGSRLTSAKICFVYKEKVGGPIFMGNMEISQQITKTDTRKYSYGSPARKFLWLVSSYYYFVLGTYIWLRKEKVPKYAQKYVYFPLNFRPESLLVSEAWLIRQQLAHQSQTSLWFTFSVVIAL